MRAIYLLVALVISAQAHADNMAKVPQLTGDIWWSQSGGPPNCIPYGSPLSGEPVPCGGVPIAHADGSTGYHVSRTVNADEFFDWPGPINLSTYPSLMICDAHSRGCILAKEAKDAIGGSGGINTTQQVLDAKLLIDDIGEKQKAKDELAKSSADMVTVVLGKLLPIQTCTVTPEGFNNGILNYCGPPTVKVSRQLIIDALQSQIDDDKAKLSAMGIKQ